MELDFNLQVTHFPTGKKHQNCPQKLNCHHLTTVRQSLSADLSSAACHTGSTQGFCTESKFSDAFCPTWKGRMKSFSQLPSRAAPASAAVWTAVVGICLAHLFSARTKQKWGSQSFCVCWQMLVQNPCSGATAFLGQPRLLPGWKCVRPWFGFI